MTDRSEWLRRARDRGIPFLVATDAAEYIKDTLENIAEEWNRDPIDLLYVLALAFPSQSEIKQYGETVVRGKDESLDDFCGRLDALRNRDNSK